MQPEPNVLPPGTVLRDRYTIVKAISSGGFGNVYLADDPRFVGKVAVKEAFFNDEETKRQFYLEADVLRHIEQKNVVRGYDAFEQDGRFYLVMQYVEGLNIEELQIKYFKESRHPIPEQLVLNIMATVCSATQALHDKQILHRDIKPANIKLDGEGKPILLDLGLAKLYKSPQHVTLVAARAYTPGYAPPEQCEESGFTTELTDVYALGATTYYALTGRQPWEAIKRLTTVLQRQPDMPPPSHWLKDVSPATDAVVMRALALEPDKRYPSATAMQHALEGASRLLALPANQREPVMCTRCYVPNSQQDEHCVNCGNTLPYRKPATVAAPPTPAPQPVEVKSPVTQLPTVVVTPPAVARPTQEMSPLPALPEQVRPQVYVPITITGAATMTLLLGVLSMIPVMGWIFLPFVFPSGLRALNVVRRSRGARRGIRRANIGMLFGLVGVLEIAGLIWLFAHGGF
jgi:serine/threonine protein kinase